MAYTIGVLTASANAIKDTNDFYDGDRCCHHRDAHERRRPLPLPDRHDYNQGPSTALRHQTGWRSTEELTKHKQQLLMPDKGKQPRQGDKTIKEGYPLPDNGDCCHYDTSYRWFRFSCCGKCYPCDVCHNEKERDHEMNFATMVICGFCAKEQPYSSKKPNCVFCDATFNPVGKGHSKGGKVCRDVLKVDSSFRKMMLREMRDSKEKDSSNAARNLSF